MLKEMLQSVQSVKRLGQTGVAVNRLALRWLRNREQNVPELMRDTMQDLGSTYIKLGQLIASSPTIFPEPYVDAFQSCLDQTPALEFSVIEGILEKEFGPKLKTRFKRIEKTPLGSASIAQVHAATLINGDEVVIKVQKPGVENILHTDFQFLHLATRMIEAIHPKAWKSSLRDIVEEIRNGMLEECDFHQEADNIEEFDRFLMQAKITQVCVPKVYRELSTKKVLVMQRFYGVPISDIDGVRAITADPEFALMQALNVWFSSLKQCQIYHADLHAGNVMMLNDGRVGFIDFGIVGRLSERTWQGITSLLTCVPAQDFDGMAGALNNIGATKGAVDLKNFASDLKEFWLKVSSDEVLDDDSPDAFWKAIMVDFTAISARHGIRFPREFTLLLKQFLYFDRYIRLLAPEVDLFETSRMGFV